MRVKRIEKKGADERRRGQNYRENDSSREGIGEFGKWDWSKEGII
jgi:hypothetical protein